MGRNRWFVGLAIVFLILFVWSAAALHWRYVIALIVASTALFLADLIYSHLLERLPDSEQITTARNLMWKRTIGPDFPRLQNKRALGSLAVDNGEEARWLLDHVDVALDRQLVKACGLLAFNALVMALMTVEMGRLPASILWDGSLSDVLRIGMLAVILGLAASSVICLTMFWVYWGKPDDYGKFASEYAFNINTLACRTHAIALGVYISGLSLIGGMGVMALTELVLRPTA